MIVVEADVMAKLPEGVYRRGSTLWIRYGVRGVKYREPVKTTSPREAAKIRRRRIEQHERGERTAAAGKLTVADVVRAVLVDYETRGLRSLRTARGHVAAITAALGRRLAIDCTTDVVEAQQRAWQVAGLTNASINRRCNILRRGFRLAVRARTLAVVPYIPRLEERSPRGRYITPSELETIRTHLPPHLQDFVRFAYLDGIRKGQLARTKRRFVDLERGVIAWPAEECKHKDDAAHVVPLEPGGTLEIVERLMQRPPLWCPYLFHGPRCAAGRKVSKQYGCIGDFKKAWTTALERAGLPAGRKAGGFTFHHTRNSAVTNLIAAGLTETDAMKVTGHQTAAVFRRYDIGDVAALRERLAERTAYVEGTPGRRRVAPLKGRGRR